MLKAFTNYLETNEKKLDKRHSVEGLQKVIDSCNNMQILLIFTNEDLSKITEITSKFIVEKQAKVGAISPIEVTLPAGPTGMDSSQIEYFQALKINTKVVKNQLDIVTAAKILVVGQKISMSEINLMKKFNIKPYKHSVQIQHIYMNGKLYDNAILKITPDYMKQRVETAIRNVAAFSVAANIPTKASAAHVVANAFRNILGLSLGANFEIAQAKGLGKATAAPVEKAAPKKEEKKVEKVKEPEPEEEDIGAMGDLFGF